MNRRDLEHWVVASRARLAAQGISALFGFGPSIGRAGGASWVSFISRRGSGRLVRAPDGSSRSDVYGFADGACLGEARDATTSVDQLERIVGLLGAPVVLR